MSQVRKPTKGYIRLLKRYPLFRKLFAARAISLLGDWLNLLALLALLREMGLVNPQVLSALFILKLLPNFVVSPIAGIAADRFSRQRVMMISDLARFALVLAFFLAPFFKTWATIFILVITSLQAAASAFFEPAKNALLPELVEKEDLAPANALNALTWSITYALGSALGGLITFLLGWRLALVLDAGSYLFSAWLVISIKRHRDDVTVVGRQRARGAGWGDIKDGVAYVRRHAEIAYVVIIKAAWSLAGAIPLLLTLYGEKKYDFAGRPDIGTAFLFACRAIGTGIGPILGQRFFSQNRQGLNRAIWYSFALGSLLYMVFGAADNPMLAGFAIVLAHVGGSIVWVFSTVRLQQIVPNEYRGRIFAAEMGLATLMISLSTYGIGWLADVQAWSLPSLAYLLGGLLGLSGVFCWLLGGVWLRLDRPIKEKGLSENMELRQSID